VTVTALMPGPTDTEFFDRAGMQGTKLREKTAKDDPAEAPRTRSGQRASVLSPLR
jgi:short-subunit dehydrogenase